MAQNNLPRQNISIFKLADEATGEVNFSEQELSVFPQGAFIMGRTDRTKRSNYFSESKIGNHLYRISYFCAT
jgi:hypothetical protein